MELTISQLQTIMPHLPAVKAQAYIQPLNAAMAEAQINSPTRIAAYLAQIAHESMELHYMSEVWGPTAQQLRYDPPSTLAVKLGNTQAGDGFRYRGSGPIQVTGRANFRKAGVALGLDLENHPEQAFTAAVGFRLACWYWTSHNLNSFADSGDFVGLTRAINGGVNGLDSRERYWATAKQILGA